MDKNEMYKFFSKLENGTFQTSTTAKGLYTIQQTERNKLKAESMDVFAQMLKNAVADMGEEAPQVNVDMIKDGIAVSVYNDSLEQEIVFIINPTIPALANNGTPFDVAYEAEEYAREVAEKNAEKVKKAQAKAAKAKRDAELRAMAKKKREEEE